MADKNNEPVWRRAAENTLNTALHLKAMVEETLNNETGLLLADNEALINLASTDGPLRMSDIADRLVLSPGGATKVIDRLEAKGYVNRIPDPSDRRATILQMTAEGRTAMSEARAVIDRQLEASWAAHLSDEEAAIIQSVMSRVHDQIKKKT